MNSDFSLKTRTISITSGKGGVGKTSILSNLAYALALQGKRILILDGDLGMANVDLFFGTRAPLHLLDVLNGEKNIDEILFQLHENIDLISGGSGIVELNRLSSFERRNMIDSLSSLDCQYDYLLIDTAPGISDNVLYLNSASEISAVVINSDPSSIADSYALIKVLHQQYQENRFSIICNQVKDDVDGQTLFSKFSEVVSRFMNVSLDYWGAIPQDTQFRKLNQQQKLILKHDGLCATSQALVKISHKMQVNLQNSHFRTIQKTGLQFFWEQVVGAA